MVNLMKLDRFIGAWLLVPLLLAIFPLVAEAGKYKVGDVVQVYDDWRNEWKNGTVVDINRRGELLIETSSRLSLKRDVYHPRAVRFAFEDGAVGPARTWKDASGSFKVLAAPLGVEGEMLKIRKEDMTELEVPIAKLSESDQSYIERLKREMGSAITPVPENLPAERFSESGSGNTISSSFGAGDGRIAILPDPLPAYMRLREGGVAFGRTDASFWGEEFGVIIPVGGPQSLILASGEVHPRWSHRNQKPITRILWISVSEQKVINEQKLPENEFVLDYHPPTHRLLTYSYTKGDVHARDKEIALAIWEVLPTDESVKPVVRWETSPSEGLKDTPYARLIDGNTVLQRRNDGEYVGWDIAGKTIAYRFKQESFFKPLPTFSGSKRYGFLPEDKKVRVFEPLSGTTLTSLPAPNGSNAIAVSEDGKRVAVLDRNQITVWDLTDASKQPLKYHADQIGSASVNDLFWLGNDKLMATARGEMYLFSLPQRIVLWSYQFQGKTQRGAAERPLVHVINDHLVYSAIVEDDNGNSGLAVGNVRLPGPKVMDVFDGINREDLEIIKPGTRIRLEVRCGDEINQDVYVALKKKIEENDWILDQENPYAIMYADAERQNSVTTEYVVSGPGVYRRESVTYTPNLYKLKIAVKDEDLWSSQMRSGLPPFITIRPEESIQSRVPGYEKLSVSYFENVDLPARVMHPQYARGLGTTDVTTRGLIAGDLKPPPKFDDEETTDSQTNAPAGNTPDVLPPSGFGSGGNELPPNGFGSAPDEELPPNGFGSPDALPPNGFGSE